MSDTALGVWYMLIASFLFTLMAVFVKLLPGIPELEIIFFRSIISVVICIWSLKRIGVALMGKNYTLLIMRGVVGAIALTMNFYLIKSIPLATASTLFYLAPICTTLLGIFIVKERVTLVQFGFFILSFIGVMVVEGFDPRISLFHLVLGIINAFMMGLAYNLVRKLSSTEHPLVIIFYFPLVCLPVTGIACLINWVQPTGWQWFYLVMVGLTTQVAQYYMTLSYQKAKISTVSSVNFTGIIYSISLGYILFDEHFNLMTYVGMFLVLAGMVLNVYFKDGLSKIRKVKEVASE